MAAAVQWVDVCCFWQLKEYDFVMDDEIEFVQALPMSGTLTDKVSNHFSCIVLDYCNSLCQASYASGKVLEIILVMESPENC